MLCAYSLPLLLRSFHASLSAASMPTRFFGADAGRRAHQELIVLCLSSLFPAQQSAQDGADESQWNADYPRILERKDRRRLNQVSGGGNAGRIDSHNAWADDNQQDRRRQTRAQPTHRAARGKAFPE